MATKITCDSCDSIIVAHDSKAMINVSIKIKPVTEEKVIAEQTVDLCSYCAQAALKYLDFKSKPRAKPEYVERLP